MSAVIFDLDGTLIDSAPDIHAAVTTVFASHGLPPLTFEQVRGFIGNGVGVLISRCISAAGLRETPDLHDRMAQQFHDIYETEFHLTSLFGGARETLAALSRDGFKIGLCTNKPERPTRAVLAHFGILDLFDAMTCGDSPFPRKPDPAPLRHLTDILAARHFLFVGDSEVDAQTAKTAGLPFAIFTRGYRKAPVDTLCHDAQFEDFSQLRPIIDSLAPLPE